MQAIEWLKKFLRNSSRLHVRTGVESVVEAIGVIDRFIDGRPTYALEWDDFISWENSIAGVERLRREIAQMEEMFFSADKEIKLQAYKRLLEIRNRYAALNGLSDRAD